MSVPVVQRTPGAVRVPSPDGYHYGDDHEWGAAEQASLVAMLRAAGEKLASAAEREAGQSLWTTGSGSSR